MAEFDWRDAEKAVALARQQHWKVMLAFRRMRRSGLESEEAWGLFVSLVPDLMEHFSGERELYGRLWDYCACDDGLRSTLALFCDECSLAPRLLEDVSVRFGHGSDARLRGAALGETIAVCLERIRREETNLLPALMKLSAGPNEVRRAGD